MSPLSHSLLGRLGKAWRARNEYAAREEVPQRWVDLLLHLDEQERRQSKVPLSVSKTRTGAPDGPAAGGKDL